MERYRPGKLLLLACTLATATLIHAPTPRAAAEFITLVVNTTSNSNDISPGDQVCDDGTGACSLRAAIEEANASATSENIQFAIGSGAVTIAPPAGGLPTITGQTVIDARTQPGYAGSPLVRIDGASAGPGTHGLHLATIDATYSEVHGLSITSFAGDGVLVETAYGTTIEQNYVGLASDGSLAGNAGNGVRYQGVDGGATTAQGNVIGANGANGVHVNGGTVGIIRIAGNRIGVDPVGGAARPNALSGIRLETGVDVDIGANLAAQGTPGPNIISGNARDGIEVVSTSEVRISGNYIGVAANGTSALGNARHGVSFSASPGPNQVTVFGCCLRDVIAFNGGDGIAIIDSQHVQVGSTRLFSNGGLGIDLGNDGVTLNDGTNDTDSGANGLQNFLQPSWSFYRTAGYIMTVGWDFTGPPERYFDVAFYTSTTCDPSGYGEGANRVFGDTWSTGTNGKLRKQSIEISSISFGVNDPSYLTDGGVLTATLTSQSTAPLGTWYDVSEFSMCVPLRMDNDQDRCPDTRELGVDPALGGDRDPGYYWDFFDVTDDSRIDLSDTLGILGAFGTSPGEQGYRAAMDRIAPNPVKPYRTAAATDVDVGIDLSDALINLESFGHECA